eukprot:769705-Prorocentrum_minimum.AAC.1
MALRSGVDPASRNDRTEGVSPPGAALRLVGARRVLVTVGRAVAEVGAAVVVPAVGPSRHPRDEVELRRREPQPPARPCDINIT